MGALRVEIRAQKTDFNLTFDESLPDHGVTAIYGHSGSGKTTFLRCLAGLESNCSGKIIFRDHTWQNNNFNLPAHKRPIGYVFQESSLFSHLSAAKNLEFAIKRASSGKVVEFDEVIKLLGIEHLLTRFPAQLSGGERQRVAIARALLINPHLLLMDEPLSSLDHSRKQEVMPYLELIKKEFNLPIIYVTHSCEEITRLADYLVVLKEGKVMGAGKLTAMLTQLDSPVMLGEDTSSILIGQITQKDTRWSLAKVNIGGADVWLRDNNSLTGSDVRIRVLARDISLSLEKPENTSILNTLPATVEKLQNEEHGGLTLVKLQVGKQFLISRISRRSAHTLEITPGKRVWAQIKSVAIV